MGVTSLPFVNTVPRLLVFFYSVFYLSIRESKKKKKGAITYLQSGIFI